MCDRVIAAVNTQPDILQSHHCQRRPNGRVNPCPSLLTFGSHACHPQYCPVVKPLEGFLQTWGHNPRLGPKQDHCLYHRHIKPLHRSTIHSLTFQYLRQPSPFSPLHLEVTLQRLPVVVRGRQCLYQVPERRDCRQRFPIGQEDPTPPSVPPPPPQPTSSTSSLSCTGTFLKSGAPN